MLIRFKNNKDDAHIYNTEYTRELRVTCDKVADGDMVIIENDNEQHFWHFSSQEQALKVLDKIYTAYADGARAITIEVG